jgi:uncharacterized protein (DUF4213/DUF364 family)
MTPSPRSVDAEIVFITGLTLINGTFLEVLNRTPRAKYRVLLGPTVPCSPLFFDYGIHLIGSTLISDASLAIRYFQHGGTSIAKAPAQRPAQNQPRDQTTRLKTCLK